VIFVDQYGDGEEDPVRHRLGETRHLRRLLAPGTSRQETLRQLVKIRHLKLDQLDRETLADARLVVIAGVADPGAQVELLREYVLQGGQLVIAAGGDYDPAINAGFDPDKWMDAAWLGGNGILPAPLKPGFLGATPREQGHEIKPFFLSFDSLQSHAYFKLAGVGDDGLRDLYAEPFFFKAAQPDVSADAVQALLATEALRLDEEAQIVAAAAHHAKPAGGQEPKAQGGNGQGAAGQTQTAEDQSRLARIRPSWLVWNNSGTAAADDELPAEDGARQRRVAELAERTRPRVLARFNDPAETPFLVERQVGRGSVLLVTTGLLSDWNTLPKTNAMLIFDRVLRAMVEATLPARNFPPQERLALALPAAAVRDATVILRRPGDDTPREALDVGYVGRDQLGVTIPRPLTRGLYRVVATRPVANGGQSAEETVWETPLAINGSAAESELTPLARDDFEARVGNARVRWVGPDEDISLAGSQIRGQASWWWVILVVLGLLVLELLLLSAPMWRAPRVTLQQA
jgi:hypothetical protein